MPALIESPTTKTCGFPIGGTVRDRWKGSSCTIPSHQIPSTAARSQTLERRDVTLVERSTPIQASVTGPALRKNQAGIGVAETATKISPALAETVRQRAGQRPPGWRAESPASWIKATPEKNAWPLAIW